MPQARPRWSCACRARAGQEVGHEPAEYYGLAACPEGVGDGEPAADLDDLAGDAHDVGAGVLVDGLASVLIADGDAEVGGSQRG